MSGAWHERLGVFDLETTGVDVATSRIVTAFVGVIDAAGAVIEGRSWLAEPGVPIPPQATAVHGVTDERARAEGRPAPEVVSEIVDALRALLASGHAVAAYNARYDFSLLAHEARRHGVEPLDDPRPIIDPLVIDRAVDRYRRGKRTLSITTAHYGVELDDAHDAAADAVAAGRVAQSIAARFPEQLGMAADRLHDLQVRWSLEQAASFQEYMRRVRDPLFVASGVWPVALHADAPAPARG